MDKVSYALGLGIGQQLKSMGAQDLCIDDLHKPSKTYSKTKNWPYRTTRHKVS